MSSLLSLDKPYTYTGIRSPNAGANGSYPDTDTLEATDGTLGNEVYSNSAYFGVLSATYNAPDGGMVMTIDLEDTYTLDYVRFHYFNDGGGIKYPATLVVEGSTDNSNFDTLDSFVQGTDWSTDTGYRWSNNLTVSGDYRYIRFTTTNAGDWCFFSEFEVYGDPVAVTDIFSKDMSVSLPADDTDLTKYTAGELTNVATDDTDYAVLELNSTGYGVHLFKKYNALEAQSRINATVIAKSGIAPSSSTVYLQIYNRTTEEWETLDSDNSSNANTEFTLTGSVTSDLADYYDVSYIVSLRIYQQV